LSQCASGLFKSHSTSHALENSGTRGFVPWRHIASGNLTEKLSICLKINPQSVILSFLSIFPSGRCPRVRPRLLDRRRRSFPAVFPHTIGRFVPPSPRFSLLPISFFSLLCIFIPPLSRSGNLGGDLCATNELKHGGSLGRGQAFDASMSNCLEVSFAHEDLDAHEIWIRSQPQLQPSLSWSSKGAGTIERLSG